MREIGTMVIPENGAEAFELACKKARNEYEVKRSITGYFRLFSDELKRRMMYKQW
jgi:hypothetical protein